MSSTVRAYAAKAPGEPLQPFAYESPGLGEHDLRVSITHCGLCYTDVLGIDDYYEISTYPFVPGHEIVGFVSETGPAAVEFKEGDRVGIGWQGRACWQCEYCRRGDEHLCVDLENAATWKPYGGFATSVVVDSRFAYPLPDTMASEAAAVLMCAGLAVYAPLRRYPADPTRHVGIVGVGGLGHLAIQFAHALGCEVTAISSSPDKEGDALRFGADHFVIGDREGLRTLEDRFDLLLCTVHGEGTRWERLMFLLRRDRGRLVLVGFPHISLDSQELVVRQLSITGSILGSRATMREMLQFSQAHGVSPAVELMPMSSANEAIQRLKQNRVRYRIVLANEAVGAA
jgi:uncharacterized zinc-type alcohol dehydrogenase-like protein